MVRKKDKYVKVSTTNLIKVKTKQNCAKKAELNSATAKKPKDFVDEINVEDLHKKGIVVKADFSGKEFGEIVYVKLFADSKQHEICTKNPSMHALNTNGIGRWNYMNEHNGLNRKRSYETFYPNKQVSNVLIGEIVTGESKESVVLGNSSIAQRVENLCVVMSFVEPEEALIIKQSAIEVMESYLIGVIEGNKMIARDREYILGKFRELKTASPVEIPERFRVIKKELQKKLSQNKMERKRDC